MAKPKIDFKKLFLEKGEKIGLGVAGFIAVLLLLTTLFWPGSGLFSEDPEVRAKELKQKADSVQARLRSAQPSATDLPDPAKETGAIQEFVFTKLDDSEPFRVGELFAARSSVDQGRRQPKMFAPTEGSAAVVLSQLRSFIFDRNWKQVAILKAASDLKGTPIPGSRDAKYLALFLGAGGSGGLGGVLQGSEGAGGEGGAYDPSMFQPPGTGGLEGDFTRGPMKIEYVPIGDLRSAGAARLAETVRPLRQAIIVANFPYQKQIDEFRSQLRLPSRYAVLTEYSREIDPLTRRPLPSFRFLGVELQRRVVDANGNPLPKSTWRNIDLEKTFKPFIALSGLRTEPSNPELNALSFDGLVMPRLLQMQRGKYPDLAMELPAIKESLEEIKSKNVNPVKPTSPFSTEKFNIFGKGSSFQGAAMEGGYEGEGPGVEPQPGFQNPAFPNPAFPNPAFPMSGSPTPRMPGPGAEGEQPGQFTGRDIDPPDNCLIRVIDVTVRPGRIYQYRLRVRMANPNYGRKKDVASPAYFEDAELGASDWFVIPDLVHVPSETEYYSVDQRSLEGSKYKGMNYNMPTPRDHVVLQIHKWLENVADSDRSFLPVGEWAVAERVFVARGEHIGRRMLMEVPVWMETRESFVIPSKEVRRGRQTYQRPTLVVNFASPHNESILVDFEEGDETHTRMDGGERIDVREDARTELLIYTSDGKLIATDSASDRNDPKREERLDAYRDRLESVRKQAKATQPGAEGSTTPFGPSGGTPFDCNE